MSGHAPDGAPAAPRAAVLLVANNFPPVQGGSAVVYGAIARHGGRRVAVLAPRTSYADRLPLIGWREHDRHCPAPVHRLPLLRTPLDGGGDGLPGRPLFRLQDVAIRLRLLLSLLRLLGRTGARTVCVGELVASGWLLRLLRLVPGLRTVAYVHGEEITTLDVRPAALARWRRVLRAADRVVVVSRFTERAVLDLLGPQDARRIALLPNGVAGERFRPAAPRADLREAHGLAGFTFVSVCRLLEKKGVDHALRAFASLLPERPDSRFLVVGSGPFEPELRALVRALGIEGAVSFAGAVPDGELADHYRAGDVFVMPNRAMPDGDTEGFGLVFLEANACGLPVISGRDGGSTEAVQDGVNGLVVDGHDVSAIADAMRRLRDDAALRARLRRGRAARGGGGGLERARGGVPAVVRRVRKARMFFFEKKNQKTSVPEVPNVVCTRCETCKSLFASFSSEKEGLLLLAFLLLPPLAQARTLSVGPGAPYALPSQAIAAAAAGDTVQLAPGTYRDCATITRARLVVQGPPPGAGAAVLEGPVCAGKALLVVDAPDVVLRGLTLRGATVADGNGAGVRAEGGSLLLDRLRIEDSQDGVLANDDPDAVLTVRDSVFLRDGACVGACAHGIYAGHVARLAVTRSRFEGTREGHAVKSRALSTAVEDSELADGPEGTGSYLVDLPEGGALLLRRDRMEKGPHAGNPVAVSLGEEAPPLPPLPTASVVVEDCQLRNDGPGEVTFVRNTTGTPARLSGNTLEGAVRALSEGTGLRGAVGRLLGR